MLVSSSEIPSYSGGFYIVPEALHSDPSFKIGCQISFKILIFLSIDKPYTMRWEGFVICNNKGTPDFSKLGAWGTVLQEWQVPWTGTQIAWFLLLKLQTNFRFFGIFILEQVLVFFSSNFFSCQYVCTSFLSGKGSRRPAFLVTPSWSLALRPHCFLSSSRQFTFSVVGRMCYACSKIRYSKLLYGEVLFTKCRYSVNTGCKILTDIHGLIRLQTKCR
jgi:hypothetical protein